MCGIFPRRATVDQAIGSATRKKTQYLVDLTLKVLIPFRLNLIASLVKVLICHRFLRQSTSEMLAFSLNDHGKWTLDKTNSLNYNSMNLSGRNR